MASLDQKPKALFRIFLGRRGADLPVHAIVGEGALELSKRGELSTFQSSREQCQSKGHPESGTSQS